MRELEVRLGYPRTFRVCVDQVIDVPIVLYGCCYRPKACMRIVAACDERQAMGAIRVCQ